MLKVNVNYDHAIILHILLYILCYNNKNIANLYVLKFKAVNRLERLLVWHHQQSFVD